MRIREGNTALHDGDLDAALKAFNEALDADEENPYAWNNKGVVLEGLGRGVEALNCYNRTIAIRPHYVEAWVKRPAFAEAWFLKARVLQEARRPEESILCLEKALELSPKFGAARDVLARAKAQTDGRE